MSKEQYLNEVSRRLKLMFSASKDGYKTVSIERHRLEGFMQAGVFLELTTNTEMSQLMNDIHVSVFDKTIEQRKAEKSNDWQSELIDYAQYEQPTYIRQSS